MRADVVIIPSAMHSLEHGSARPTVFLVENDDSVRIALERLLISSGIPVRSFPSAASFLAEGLPHDGACVIADVRMGEMTGLELQRNLKDAGRRVHFILLTAYDSEAVRAEAMKAGAVAYFRKPVDDQALLDAIAWAFSRGTASS